MGSNDAGQEAGWGMVEELGRGEEQRGAAGKNFL